MKFLVSSLASRDPAMASALLDQVPPQDLLYESGVIGRVWALCDPKAALAFANQQSDPVVKSSLLSEVIGSMALTDPQGALPLARAAVSSALSLPPGESELDKQDMKALLSRAANLIYVLDPQGALATYQSLPVGEARDAFAKNISNSEMAQTNPQRAITIASGMTGNDRFDTMRSVVSLWSMVDPAAATQWINRSSLPQDQKTDLLSNVENNRPGPGYPQPK